MLTKIRTTFDKVSVIGIKRFVCACGRKLRRKKEFYQTLNPYNRTKDGNVKGRDTIYSEIMAQREQWMSIVDPCTHAK